MSEDAKKIKKVGSFVNFPEVEKKVLELWKKNNIYEKSLEINKNKPRKVIYDGPITANGAPHHGHMLTFTLKDIIPRFWSMRGFYAPRSIGWDCQGLPVETEVEKKLGFKEKKDIEKYGIEKFNQLCRDSVLEYRKEIEFLEERMGRLTDKQEEYSTMDKDYIESIWWSLSELYKKGLMYEGFKVVPYSPRAGTSLSASEVALGGYSPVTEKAITVKFKVYVSGTFLEKITKEHVYILAWTTTPWTLPTNFGLAVGEKIKYSLVEKDNEFYILASELLEKNGFECGNVLREFLGKELIGLSYKPLFDYFLDKENAFKVYEGFHVTTESGTGIVHLAPYGIEDNEIFNEVGIESIDVLDEQGDFIDIISDLKGMYYLKANSAIISNLENKNLLFKVEDYTHDLPFCWRTKVPLIYKPVTSWYIKTKDIRDELVKENNNINWVPSHFRDGRFGNWLAELKDWGISRTRYWGTPLPIWKGEKTGKIIFIGSYEELEKLSGMKIEDPHRPFIDEVHFEFEGEKYSRIKDVIDVWYDSGAMPFARLHYPFENKDKFQESYPADYIAEGVDQTRGWFYSLHAIGTSLFNKKAFKTVVTNGFALDDKKTKLSKSKKNYSPPLELIDSFGADSIRYNFCSTPIVAGEDVTISAKTIRLTSQEVLIPLWNIFSYFTIYAEMHNFQRKSAEIDEKKLNSIDKWLVTLIKIKTKEITNYYENYQLQKVAESTTELINSISKWYIRLNRNRFVEGDEISLDILFFAIDILIALLAPVIPFVTEEIYQNLHRLIDKNAPESVHLLPFPRFEMNEKEIKNAEEILENMKFVQEISSVGQKIRVENGLKLRQPLSELIIRLSIEKSLDEDLFELIKNELNVKAIKVILFKANKEKKEFYENTYKSALNNSLFGKLSFDLFLNTELTPELKNEGLMNELKRIIQQERKNKKLNIGEMIKTLELEVNNNSLSDLINKELEELKKAVSAEVIKVSINSSLTKENGVALDEINLVKVTII